MCYLTASNDGVEVQLKACQSRERKRKCVQSDVTTRSLREPRKVNSTYTIERLY